MTDKRLFPGLSPHAFEHPLDRSAARALEKVPGLDWVIKRFINSIGERRLRLVFLASAARVSPAQLPKLHASYLEACRILDVQDPPELYLASDFVANAAAIGVDKPFIVVTSALAETLDERELQCVLGHELGHVMAGHALYTTMLIMLIRLWQLFVGMPGGAWAVPVVVMALLEWSRKAELSADRAGLLVSQNPAVSYRVDMKLAAGKLASEMSLEGFLAQAKDYQSGGDVLDGVLKLGLLLGSTHPFPALRVAELKKWVDEGGYDAILRGEYARRGATPEKSWLDEVKATAGEYKEAFATSQDPLVTTLRELGGGAAAAGAELVDLMKGVLGRRGP